jgi:hypothetical protein
MILGMLLHQDRSQIEHPKYKMPSKDHQVRKDKTLNKFLQDILCKLDHN